MGQGIANAFASAGNDVTVVDVKKEWAENGINKIKASKDKLVAKGKISAEDAEAAKANLKAGEYEDLADADLIVEAALEDMKLKKEVFKNLMTSLKKMLYLEQILLLYPLPKSQMESNIQSSVCTSSTRLTA